MDYIKFEKQLKSDIKFKEVNGKYIVQVWKLDIPNYRKPDRLTNEIIFDNIDNALNAYDNIVEYLRSNK